MRLLIFFLLFFVLVACGSKSQVSEPEPSPKATESEPSSKATDPEPPSNYCFENPITRNVVRGGLLGFAIWGVVEYPDVAVNALVLAFILKGLDLFFSEPKETMDALNEEANQILCEL